MARTASKQQQRTLEQQLWDAADALRGRQELSEYVHVGADHFSHAGIIGAGSKLTRTLQKFAAHSETRA